MSEKLLPRGMFYLADLPGQSDIAALSSGWWELDQIYKPYPGQFTVITGLAGHGKSTFAFNLVTRLTHLHGIKPILFVPENELSIRRRLQLLWPGSPESFQFFMEQECIIRSAIIGGEREYKTMHWVLESAYQAIKDTQSELVLIDPWNELERIKPADMLLTDYVNECLFTLKDFCRQLHAIVMVVAHPTKGHIKDNRPPTLADIEGSMNWFNKCDNGLVISRDQNGTTKLVSAKVRFQPEAGKPGECYFHVDAKTGIFTPIHGGVSL